MNSKTDSKTESIKNAMGLGKAQIIPSYPHQGKPIEPGISLEECSRIIFKEGCIPELETEMEIYTIIEGLGGITWQMGHDSADGRMELTGNDMSFMEVAKRLSYLLVQRLKDRYNVIPPDECPQREIGDHTPRPPAPSGWVYYWDWYNKIQGEYFTDEYHKIICSGCALHDENPEEVMRRHVPCGVFSGMIYRLIAPFECAMIEEGGFRGSWTKERLHEELRKVGGEKAVQDFEDKYTELFNVWQAAHPIKNVE